MSRNRPDERDQYVDKHSGGAVQARWVEERTDLHAEPWLFRALRDIDGKMTSFGEEQVKQGKAIARVEGEVTVIKSVLPRPKSPSNGVASALLADKLDESKVRRRWWLKVGGGLLLIVAGAIGKMLVG